MKKIYLFLFMCVLYNSSKGNGIRLSNLSSTYNAGTQVATVNFDVTWDNSWRNSLSGNWDAAWIFFKFNNGGTWTHLSLTGSDVTMPSGVNYNIPSDKTGILVYRNADGTGTMTLTGCKVGVTTQWGNFDIKAFALEMVYIPQGAFFAGDGYSINRFQNGTASYRPYLVNGNAGATTMGTNAGQLYDPYGSGTLATGYPTGYDSFYVMKYELSWGGYRDFLNCLNFTQQQTRTGRAPNSGANQNAFSATPSYRTKILKIQINGTASSTPAVYGCDEDNDNLYNEPNDGENVAADSLSWPDLAAYLDWSGLRPITELEYEKACRGIDSFAAGEMAWGSIGWQGNPHTYIYTGTDSERVSNAVVQGMANFSNTNYNTTMAPNTGYGAVRNGIFGFSTTNRWKSGATYYGVMEMSGNCAEMVVNTWSAAGRSYTGKNGDGTLDLSGNATVDYWPGINGNVTTGSANATYQGTTGVTGFAGMGWRGGCYADANIYIMVSNRSFISTASTSNRARGNGIRGARSF